MTVAISILCPCLFKVLILPLIIRSLIPVRKLCHGKLSYSRVKGELGQDGAGCEKLLLKFSPCMMEALDARPEKGLE